MPSNYRLEVIPNRSVVTVAFNTNIIGKGCNINLQWSAGTTSMHGMQIDGHSISSQSPAMNFSTGIGPAYRFVLQPNSTYVMTITTPDYGLTGTYHLNFQNAPY